MKFTFSGQVADLLQKVSARDFSGIKENIESIGREPAAGRHLDEENPPVLTLPHSLRHVCLRCGWLLDYRFAGTDAAIDADTIHLERLESYARM